MPLVRVTGVDADAFDISDVARMNDHSHPRKAWHQRRTNNNPADGDETPSTDSSSMVYSDRDGGAGSMGGRSFASVNTAEGTGCSTNNRSYNISGTVNSAFDNYYDDPRNPFDTTQKIPEEDEDCSSTAMEDCSLSGTISSHRGTPQQPLQQSLRRTNSQRSHSTMSSTSRHHSSSAQQRHNQLSSTFREEEETDDNISIASSIQTSSLRHKDILATAHPSSTYTSQLVSQLESQVAKLNFELAMTKSSLDEIQLENRKLQGEKSDWHKKIKSLQEENDQLRLKMERMERDKLMRTMESTKGVAKGRTRTSIDNTSCVVWGGSSVSGNTWADSKRENSNTIASYKQELKQVEKLDVSFPNSHTYKQPHRSSFASTGSYKSFDDLDKSVGSIGSVNLDLSDDHGQQLEEDVKPMRSSLLGSLRPMQRLQGINKMVSSAAPSQRKNDDESSTQSNSLVNESAAADVANHKSMDHIDEELYDEDDPFATWSENRERLSTKKKWFQRGDGQKHPQSQDIDAEEEELAGEANEGRDEAEEDPFDTAKGDNIESEYTSFADASNHSDDGTVDDIGSVTQQSKRGVFRLPWQRGNEGR